MNALRRPVSSPPLLAVCAGTALLAVHVWSLLRYPAPFVDEAWYASRAWGWLQTGQPFGALDHGVIERFPGYTTLFTPLGTWLLALGEWAFGGPRLLSVRVVSLVFGLLLLGAVYAIGLRLGGPRLGAWSAGLLSVSIPFFYSSHMARSDVYVAALGFSAIALVLHNPPAGVWRPWLAGVCVGLAFELHPYGAIYGPVVAALFLWRFRRAVWRSREFWAFALGLGLGLAAYVAYHILPYPDTYFAVNRVLFGPGYQPPVAVLYDPRVVVETFADTLALLFLSHPLLLAVAVWAGVALWRGRRAQDLTLLLLVVALLAAFALWIRNKGFYYAIFITPAVDLLVAAFALQALQRPWPPTRTARAGRVLVVLLAVLEVAGLGLFVALNDQSADFAQVQSRVNASIQPGDVLIGPQTFWFGLSEHAYYSWEQLVYYRRYAPGSTVEDAFGALQPRPTVFIVDAQVAQFISDDPQKGNAYWQNLRLPRAELDAFLARRAQLLDEFSGAGFGDIRIYRIDWERGAGSRERGEHGWGGPTRPHDSARSPVGANLVFAPHRAFAPGATTP